MSAATEQTRQRSYGALSDLCKLFPPCLFPLGFSRPCGKPRLPSCVPSSGSRDLPLNPTALARSRVYAQRPASGRGHSSASNLPPLGQLLQG